VVDLVLAVPDQLHDPPVEDGERQVDLGGFDILGLVSRPLFDREDVLVDIMFVLQFEQVLRPLVEDQLSVDLVWD
jgi:hypothetical protein